MLCLLWVGSPDGKPANALQNGYGRWRRSQWRQMLSVSMQRYYRSLLQRGNGAAVPSALVSRADVCEHAARSASFPQLRLF
jgi:hypothetical protein